MSELEYIKVFQWDIELLYHETWNTIEGNYYRCMSSDDRIFTMLFPSDGKLNPRIIRMF